MKIGSVAMNKRNITKSQRIIQKSINYYLTEMSKLHANGFEDETAVDVEDWAAAKSMIYGYLDGRDEELDKKELLYYLGDENRTNLVLSYYNIAKSLLKDGITLNI